jgi:hypothetical protein
VKGFRTTIKAGFAKQALVNEWLPARNSGLFLECKNLRGKPTGLEGYNPDMADLLSGLYPTFDFVSHNPITLTRRWPFPQLFMTDVGLIVGAKEGLYFVASMTPPIYLAAAGTGPVTWPWSCIPIPLYPAFVSGNVFVYYDEIAATYVMVT